MMYKRLLEPFKEKKPVKPPTGSQTPSPQIPKKLGSKTDYVPPWWKGEKGAYESAKRAMSGINSLPKMSR